MKNIQIGLLDFGVRTTLLNSLLRVNDLIEYAQNAEELGFSRIWLAEHHVGDAQLTWNNPESLIPIVAGMTQHIRVGAAGILIGVHNPYHIACSFKLYNNLFNNRIDLGMANGGVSQHVANYTLNADKSESHKTFEAKFRQVIDFYANEQKLFDEENIVLPPYKGTPPEVWSLGVGYGNSMKRSLETGANLSRSIFHFDADLNFHKEQLLEYTEKFIEKHNRKPKVSLVFSGCCHETTNQAKDVVKDMKLGYHVNIVGCKNLFHDTICQYQENYGIDEIIFKNVALTPEDRLIGIQLLSDVFMLKGISDAQENYIPIAA